MTGYIIIWSIVFAVVTACGDHYWRDYDNTIPADAIPAGNGVDREEYYIGQVYNHGIGLAVGTIRKGRKEVATGSYGIKRVIIGTKILCAQDHKKFYWLPVTSADIAAQVKNKCPVLGGIDGLAHYQRNQLYGTLYIGRKKFHDEIVIGTIAFYGTQVNGLAPMHFAYDGEEYNTTNYEVLVYIDTPTAEYNGVDNVYKLDVVHVDH